MNPIVRKYLQKQIFKQKGAIGSAKSVEFAYNALETKMKNIGLDINLIKSEKDLSQALGFVKNIEDQVFQKQFGNTLSKKDIAKVFDLEGRQLDTKKSIMGGTQSEEDILQKSIKKNVDEATKKGDFKGIFNQVLRDPDIAREFMLSKKFPFRRDINVRSGEDAIPLARKAKFDDEMGIRSLPDRDYSVEKLVSDFKKFGKATDKDIQMILGSGKSGQIPYVMDNYGMSYTDVINTLKRGDPLIEGLATGGRAGFKEGNGVYNEKALLGKRVRELMDEGYEFGEAVKQAMSEGYATGGRAGFKEGNGKDDSITGITMSIEERMERIRKLLKQMQDIKKGVGIDPDPEDMADGGRAGFKVGSPSKRLFLKTAGGLAALITAIKSGLIGMPKKEVAKQVVKESAKDVANAPPKYFFDLANKIKLLGKESKVKPQERVNEYNYKGKDGSDYTLTEDISTGDMQITKDKTGIGTVDEKSFDTINDRSIMEYRAPRKDADPDTETILKEGAEYDEYKVEFDMDGTMGDGDVISENIKKEIIQEASEIPERKIKRAGGGVAYMLGE